MSLSAEEVARRLNAKTASGGFKAKCPAHDDGVASLSISTGDDGRVLLNCFAGCKAEDICKAIGIQVQDLFVDEKRPRQRITLGQLASAKKLPQDFLRGLGLNDLADGGVGMPYRNADGTTHAVKRRTALSAKEGSIWEKGKVLIPYGLERLGDARELEYLIIVEGESDCWTLWHHGFPALGVPGASASKTFEAAHLEGIKTVYFIREPDRGGDELEGALPKRLAAIGWKGRPVAVRITGAKDPNELHQQDPLGFKAKFEAMLRPPDDSGFKTAAERLVGEREDRLERAKRIMPFGVSFLDDIFGGGILPNDLVVVGAYTGAGKTALCTAITHENVKAGKHVHYFALEAEDREIERRLKYRSISDLVYQSHLPKETKQRFNYVDWYTGKLDAITGGDIETTINQRIGRDFGTLHTYYRKGNFDVSDLATMFQSVQEQTDLIVLDHLHYLDVDDANENRGVKDAVKRIRDLALEIGKPVIVVAHLRKRERKSTMLVPDLDDFHGSSDITKIATKCVLLARARDQTPPDDRKWLSPTYMVAPKFRMEGSRTHYGALISFNPRTQAYESQYVLGTFGPMASEFEAMFKGEDKPHWATRSA